MCLYFWLSHFRVSHLNGFSCNESLFVKLAFYHGLNIFRELSSITWLLIFAYTMYQVVIMTLCQAPYSGVIRQHYTGCFYNLLWIFSALSSNLFFPLSSETLFPWQIFNSVYSITGFSIDFLDCLSQVCLYWIPLSMNTAKHHQFSAGDWTQGLPHARQALYYWTLARVCQFYWYHCLSCLNYYNGFQHLFFPAAYNFIT